MRIVKVNSNGYNEDISNKASYANEKKVSPSKSHKQPKEHVKDTK